MLDAVVGLPYTTKVTMPFRTVTLSVCTVMENSDVMDSGTVENMNVEPPSGVSSSEKLPVDVIVKSEATPVVAPNAPATLILQITAADTREGEMFTQLRLDALVGVPYATNTSDPFPIVAPDT